MKNENNKLRVGILGATGAVGQNYIRLLKNHPYFDVTCLFASKNSESYESALKERGWFMESDIPDYLKDMSVFEAINVDYAKNKCDFVFSALDSKPAKEIEAVYAKEGINVVSNASSYRLDSLVPMIIPEINPGHVDIIPMQKEKKDWNGFICVKPNCSLQSYMAPVYALMNAGYKIDKIIVSTEQAASGAGRPGVSSMDLIDNIVPYIGGEDEKTEKEPLKILGRIGSDGIENYAGLNISATCTRVPVRDGHTAIVNFSFQDSKILSVEEIIAIWENFRAEPQNLDLPFAPKQPIIYRNEVNRPQPILDRNTDKGMAVTVGRLRPCNVFDYKFVCLSHNTIRGAAGGAILTAELLYKKGYLGKR
jgi:aspartate-semialdehyde dehydrogenase